MSVSTEVDAVVEEIRQANKLLLTTHENPDGDALGSLVAMHWIVKQLGKDSLMYMSPDEFPLPYEYREFTFDDLVGAPPEDMDDRVVMFLDCGNIDRMPVDFLQRDGIHILNVDHHHDNTRFGTVNLVSPEASCTAEIVFGLAGAHDSYSRSRLIRSPFSMVSSYRKVRVGVRFMWVSAAIRDWITPWARPRAVRVASRSSSEPKTLTKTFAVRRSGLVSTEVTVTNPMLGSLRSEAMAEPITSRNDSLTRRMRPPGIAARL